MVQAFLHPPANGATPTAVPQEFVEAIAQAAFQKYPAARALEADLTISLEIKN
jgi:hypothetical protein